MPELRVTADGFTLDGAPFRILSGELHYFRVHPDQWRDRLDKARLMGLNTVSTYVPWNLHEPRPGEAVFDDGLDLPRFLALAAELGLHVLLRPGPYICAEWDGGGLPAWLQTDSEVRLRTTDPRFLTPVDAWFDVLLARVGEYMADRGGPVIAVQVENEYGSFGDDTAYLAHLADGLRRRGVNVPLFTCDEPNSLARGGLPGVLRTVNFGKHVADGLAALRAQQPEAPLMCTEFWNGWFDRWGGGHVVRGADDAAASLDELLTAGASVNFYVFHGGTNFGFTNGANGGERYRPTTTSYDYDAPLDEAGDPTDKYHAFRKVIAAHAPVPAEPVPAAGPKYSAPPVRLTHTAPLFRNLDRLSAPRTAPGPLPMERLGQSSGFVLYETVLAQAGPALLDLAGFGDRVQVFVDGRPAGVLEREHHEHAVTVDVPRAGALLSLLVENLGRINYGPDIHDPKGLTGPVTLDGGAPGEWTHRCLPLDDLTGLDFTPDQGPATGPVFHRGTVHVDAPADTWLDMTGWTKGCVWINGFALGRHWSRGPQRTLYVPGPVLRPGDNEVTVLELHATRRPAVTFRDTPHHGPTEHWH